MENEILLENSQQEQTYGCQNCSSPIVEEGYELQLCKECREMLAKRPIGVGIKCFLTLIAIATLISIAEFALSLQTGINFEKGLKAEEASNYPLAIDYYKKVVDKYPESKLALGRLFILEVKTERINEAEEVFNKLEGRKISDYELADEINNAADKMVDSYYYKKAHRYNDQGQL